ncbi:MAG: C-terminal binding protein [Herpetosiphonaceae bacterium]|nr:C-terminal binding protein [Herpetosiphonaceae bacterium]
MPFNVVIAYEGFGNFAVEREILQALDANIVQSGNVDTPQALAAARQADAIIVTVQKISANLIASLERCRVISRAGTGLDAIDIPAATAQGIWVAYVPDYSVDEVSSHAVGLLLAHARGIPWLVESTRSGSWSHQVIAPRRRLSGQTLGLLGFGRIGQVVAAKARGLGLEIIVHDPYLADQFITDNGARPVDRETLLRDSDYLSLHVPLTDANRRFLDAQALALMKRTAFVINTARGGLIDEEALLRAVQSGQLAGAGLDVLTVEPPPPDHPLLHEPRIIITPHTGWYSEDANHDVRVRACEEVVRVLRGERPRYPVNEIVAR